MLERKEHNRLLGRPVMMWGKRKLRKIFQRPFQGEELAIKPHFERKFHHPPSHIINGRPHYATNMTIQFAVGSKCVQKLWSTSIWQARQHIDTHTLRLFLHWLKFDSCTWITQRGGGYTGSIFRL